MAQHKLVWNYTRCSEFDGCKETRIEIFDSWEAVNARVFELLGSHSSEHGYTTLTINWYDDDPIEPLYRHFELVIPDRG